MASRPVTASPTAARISRGLARLLAFLHGAFALFVVVGGLLAWWYPRLIIVHLAAVVWAGLTLSTDLGCVLSSWEKALWRRGGREPYPEGFLEHHLPGRPLDPEHSHRYHLRLGVLIVLLNAVVYLAIWMSR